MVIQPERIKELVESLAPPQDCSVCEHLNTDQTMPGSDIPIAYCPKVDELDDGEIDEELITPELEETYKKCQDFWAGEIYECPFFLQDRTKDELKARIAQLEEEIKDFCDDCEYRDGYCNNEPPPWTDLD